FVAVGEGTNSMAYSSDGQSWIGIGTNIFSTRGKGITWDGIKWVAVGEGTNSIAYSYNGINWTSVASSPFTIGNDIEYEDNIFVAMGELTNTIAYSYDGVNWVGLSNTIFSSRGNGCFCNGNLWVGVGEGSSNTLAYSTNNGTSWTGNGKSIFSVSGKGVVWNGDIFVAVGEGTNTIAYSSDGISWTGIGTFVFTTRGNSVAWNGEIFVAVGEGTNTIAYSYDGITWTGIGTVLMSGKGLGIVWTGKIFIVGGSTSSPSGIIAFSSNGIQWKSTNSTVFTTQCNHISFNSRRYNTINFPKNLTIGCGSGTNTLALSYDNGLTWSGLGTSVFSTEGRGVSWNGIRWVAVGEGTNTIAFTKPPLNDTFTGLGTSIFGTRGNGVIWGGNKFVASGAGGNTIAYSSDGIVWFTPPSPLAFTTTCQNVCYTGLSSSIRTLTPNQEIYIAVGSGTNTIAYSSDAVTWTAVAPKTVTNFTAGTGGVSSTILVVATATAGTILKGMILTGTGVTAGAYILYQTSGTIGGIGNYIMSVASTISTGTLISGNVGFTTRGNGVAWNGNIAVAVGEGTNTIVYSLNKGINWFPVSFSPFSTRGNDIAWNEIMFVAVGETTTIAYSYDGISWTSVISSPLSTIGKGICWSIDKWLCFGESSNSIGYSYDGISWSSVPS
ncbi:MAG: hypothetical protein EB127_21540, partial [Alphaproteobacteria bacterium]|nr:hypothetical protein [Alphaproteobacteria bacterium]